MKTLEYRDGSLWLIDQTQLPLREVELCCDDHHDVAEAIRRLSVRGAPAIGLAAAYGMALAAQRLAESGVHGERFSARLDEAVEELRGTRPTAVNLSWALSRLARVRETSGATEPRELAVRLLAEADAMLREDEEANRRMGQLGAALIPDGANVLTHCNAGALATGAYGTALGVIFAAHEQGRKIHVWVDETRPLLQGARLTAWELERAGIPYTLITDSMAGHFMARGRVDLALVGADRIAANGDVANKIGTYTVATLASVHDLPFYVAAPVSTIDASTASGREIPIEERAPGEVGGWSGTRTAPAGAQMANPAFDVTPARLVSAIVTERAVVRAPYTDTLAALLQDREETVLRSGEHP